MTASPATRPAWALPHTPAASQGRVLPPRAWVAPEDTSAPSLSLNGTWAFRLHATAEPEGTTGDGTPLPPSFDTTDASLGPWETIELPAHWVLTGEGRRGLPAYTNVQYPIPLDPPHVPDENPTADHVRTLTLPATWGLGEEGALDVLRLDGVESCASVWVNGTWAGTTQGSRLPTELDVTGLLHEGENTVALRVWQWSPYTYVEDQDQWWLPGVFRDVTLLHRPASRVDDLTTRADWDPATATGTLEVTVEAPAAAFPLAVTLRETGATTTLTAPGTARLTIDGAEPWSAEVPRLYDLVLATAGAGEVIAQRAGFRRLETVDGQVRVNGRRLVLAGVNRHEVHPGHGRVFDERWAREDLALMKAHNVNAVRTSHYPPHPRLLALADEAGLWVMDECDLETHGFEAGGWEGNPADDPAWAGALLERAHRMVQRDKNHPSVLFWSLGNESGTGRNLAAMSALVRQADPTRLIHYESDFAARYTDLASRMYPTLEEVEAAVGTASRDAAGRPSAAPLSFPGHAAGQLTPAENARSRTLPYVMCEYLHAMGTGPGGVEGYTEQVLRSPRHLGGFVWEWRDHALTDPRPEGGGALCYGGDFGEAVHDGNFVTDGMVSATSRPSAGTTAWANAVAPVTATATTDDGGRATGEVTVTNRFHTRSTAGMGLRVLVTRLGGPGGPGASVTTFEDVLPHTAPGEETTLTVPGLAQACADAAGAGEVHVLAAVLDPAVPGTAAGDGEPVAVDPATGGMLLAQVGERDTSGLRVMSVREVRAAAPSVGTAPAVTTAPAHAPAVTSAPAGPVRATTLPGGGTTLGPLTLDRRGQATSLAGTPLAGPLTTVWRAPTDNDEGHGPVEYWTVPPTAADLGAGGATQAGWGSPSSGDRWRAARLHLLTERHVSTQVHHGPGGDTVTVRTRCSAPSARWALDTTTSYRLQDGGVRVTWEAVPAGPGLPPVLPRLGLRLGLPATLTQATWAGTGPAPSYPDLTGASFHGVFTSPVEGTWQMPVRPQEAGTRLGLHALTLSGDGSPDVTAQVLGDAPVAFSVSPWDLETLTAADHERDLVPADHLWLHLDGLHHGTGSRSCGPDVRPEAAAATRPVTVDVLLTVG